MGTVPIDSFRDDLIDETMELFDNPKLFHLGMDEETYAHQATYSHAIVRNGDLWWEDFYRNLKTLEKHNVRAWVWSDYIWHHPEVFLQKMPKEVMQSNWYYDSFFSMQPGSSHENMVRAYDLLDQHGYDQIATGSSWSRADNIELTTRYCKQAIRPQYLKGFLQTSWQATIPQYQYVHLAAIDLMGYAKERL